MRWLVEAWKRNHNAYGVNSRFLLWAVEVDAEHPQLAQELAAKEKHLPGLQWASGNPRPEVCLRAFPLEPKVR